MSNRFSALCCMLCAVAGLSTAPSPALAQATPGAVVFSELMWITETPSTAVAMSYSHTECPLSNECLTSGFEMKRANLTG